MGKCVVAALGGESNDALRTLRYDCTGDTAATYSGEVVVRVHDGCAEATLTMLPLGHGKISSVKVTVDGSTTARGSGIFAYFSSSTTGCGGSVSSSGGVITITPPQNAFNAGILLLQLSNI